MRSLLLDLQACLLEQLRWQRASDGGLEVLVELSAVQLWALQAAVRFSGRCIRGSKADQRLLAQVLADLSSRLLQACPTQALPALRAPARPKETPS